MDKDQRKAFAMIGCFALVLVGAFLLFGWSGLFGGNGQSVKRQAFAEASPTPKANSRQAAESEGEITTVEGLSTDGELTPLQKSFRKHHALQCGFCTPGMLTTAHALLSEEPDCDAARVREVLSGNLCRCTGYISIVEAVLDARAAYRKDAPSRGSP